MPEICDLQLILAQDYTTIRDSEIHNVVDSSSIRSSWQWRWQNATSISFRSLVGMTMLGVYELLWCGHCSLVPTRHIEGEEDVYNWTPPLEILVRVQ